MVKKSKDKPTKSDKPSGGVYFEAVGRRKTSIARVRLFKSKGKEKSNDLDIVVNDSKFEKYFVTPELIRAVKDAFKVTSTHGDFTVTAKIKGGGKHSQAEALRHGIARALLKIDLSQRNILKQAGYLKRDPRMKERRKFGLKKARKAPQWAKR